MGSTMNRIDESLPPPQGQPYSPRYEIHREPWPSVLRKIAYGAFIASVACGLLAALASAYLDRGEYNPADVLVLLICCLLAWLAPLLCTVSLVISAINAIMRMRRPKIRATQIPHSAETFVSTNERSEQEPYGDADIP